MSAHSVPLPGGARVFWHAGRVVAEVDFALAAAGEHLREREPAFARRDVVHLPLLVHPAVNYSGRLHGGGYFALFARRLMADKAGFVWCGDSWRQWPLERGHSPAFYFGQEDAAAALARVRPPSDTHVLELVEQQP